MIVTSLARPRISYPDPCVLLLRMLNENCSGCEIDFVTAPLSGVTSGAACSLVGRDGRFREEERGGKR